MATVQSTWVDLFRTHGIADALERSDRYRITAETIKRAPGRPEPRLVTKFDSRRARPEILRDYGVTILPTANGVYELLRADGYVDITPPTAVATVRAAATFETIPLAAGLRSESQALDSAFLSSQLRTFLADESAVLTVRGRLRSGRFAFRFGGFRLQVEDVQIEVDAGYEGRSVYVVEAKFGPIDDLIVRQLYYPVRMWSQLVRKEVIPVLLVYTNKVFSLYRFAFADPDDYGSIRQVGPARHFSFEAPATIPSVADLLTDSRGMTFRPPDAPFPQADDIRKVLSTVELYNGIVSDKRQLSEELDFDERQGDYYSNAARWLGLLEKVDYGFSLTQDGRSFLALPPGERVSYLISRLLSTPVFRRIAELRLDDRHPTRDQVARLIARHNPGISGSTLPRRAATVLSWVDWMFSVQGTEYGVESG